MNAQIESLQRSLQLTVKAIDAHMGAVLPLGSDRFQALLWGRREILRKLKVLGA